MVPCTEALLGTFFRRVVTTFSINQCSLGFTEKKPLDDLMPRIVFYNKQAVGKVPERIAFFC